MMQRKKSDKSRTLYEDPNPQFVDWVEKLKLDQSFIGRFLPFLKGRFYINHLLFVFLYCFILSVVILVQMRNPQEVRVGMMAKTDLTSPMTFEMVDEVSTEEKRLRAGQMVNDVYDYDADVEGRVIAALDRAFRGMREFGNETGWPSGSSKKKQSGQDFLKPFYIQKKQFQAELGSEIPDDIYEWLIEHKFSQRLESHLIRIIENWYDKKISELSEKNASINSEVTARVLASGGVGSEFIVPFSQILDLRNPDNFEIGSEYSNLESVDRNGLLRTARSLLRSNLVLNRQETELRRYNAKNQIIPAIVSVKKNQIIVPKGSVVQPYQMAMFEQIQTLQAERRRGVKPLTLALLLVLVIGVFASYVRRFTMNKVTVSLKDLFVMMLIALAQVMLVKSFLFMMDAAFLSRGSSLPSEVFLYMAPVAAAPMLVGLLISSGEVVWLFTAFMAICLGIMEDFHLGFSVIAMVGGIAGARGVFKCRKRNDIYFAGVRAGLINAVLIAGLLGISYSEDVSLTQAMSLMFGGFLGGVISSFVAMIFVPLMESVFQYTTDVKLLELSNLNHPLMKEMIIKAPGTYHHSLMVGSMVEAAAEEIGANPLLGKVMCYYHDIGKIEHSNYYIENQRMGNNPHDSISPFMSRTLLISHAKDGVELGMKYKLGKPIIDGIIQHHGTTVIAYFYNKALDQKQETDPDFSEEEFRYPGPKPQFKEAALCMLADSIEAAARSLDEPNPTRLQNIVKTVIQRKFNDGQLDECNLSMRDLGVIEKAFVRILLGIYHQRIDYPTEQKGNS